MHHIYLLAALVRLVAGQEYASSSSSSPGAGKATASAMAEASKVYERLNERLPNELLAALAAVVVVIFLYRVALNSVRYIRTLACLNNNTQLYFLLPNRAFALAKKHVLQAPLFGTRHSREFRVSAAINMGIIPTRFQSLFISAITVMNITLCVYNLPWSAKEATMLPLLRDRTGTLACVNLVPLVIMSGRNNPLIPLLNVTYDSFNMMHRWLARLVVLEAIAHTLCWAIAKVHSASWSAVQKAILDSSMITQGFVATVVGLAILVQANSVVRHAFYETFLHLHIVLVVVFMIFTYMHVAGMYQENYVLAAVVLWAIERIHRFVMLIYRNTGVEGTRATIETLPGEALRVSFKIARPWTFRPGQHMYVTIPKVGLWTSHPFSVAWSEEEQRYTDDGEKGLVVTRQDVLATSRTTMSAIVRRRTGFTNALFEAAEKGVGGHVSLKALVEGPYGVNQPLHSYGTVVMFAGGVGITHQVPHVRDLVAGYSNGTVAARKVVLVWVIQAPEHLEWIRPWMTSILSMEKRRDILKVLLFVTRPRSTKEIQSPSATVQMFPGRPNVDTLLGIECESQVGAMAVSVCGTGSLQDSVRKAVRKRQQWSNIDFLEESFSW